MKNTENLLLASSQLIEQLENDNARLRAEKLGLELRVSVALGKMEKRLCTAEETIKDLQRQLSDLSYNVPV